MGFDAGVSTGDDGIEMKGCRQLFSEKMSDMCSKVFCRLALFAAEDEFDDMGKGRILE